MNVLGLIVEYNPFHNGHLYHLDEAKKITNADKCIAIMSGNYTQRGMPALCDKYIRTEMALKNGVDMVIELPIYYATASADYFATGSINILNSMGIVNSLCFGTELGELEKIYNCAKILLSEPDIFKKTLKNSLDTGASYPVARQEALKSVLNEDCHFLGDPNNILGLEYVKALIKTSSRIKAYAIKRTIASYHSISIEKSIASATAIRKALDESNYDGILQSTPENVGQLLIELSQNEETLTNMDSLSYILHYILKNSSTTQLRSILDIDEGLENRILAVSEKYFEISKILSSLKCKRYTLTKLQRCILHILLNIKKEDMVNYHSQPQYIRVLGFKKDSSFLLREIKAKSTLPLVTNIKEAYKNLSPSGISMLNKEIYSTDLYYLAQKKYMSISSPKNIEYTKPLIIM